ncbi:hypothetical protein GETHLI_24550 [Geothrix limicola]|uniref:Outer membrane protein beta-barrel domain-containing protein n=1 Tax=Geothrix limicola TaxID=2927978 RepID=A0ABQ5QHB2_9BACT|nr:hypothetical protein [Geothrix limicola]GLH73953.1 hypothetical protein GETHLI_24550 [Geothrix limicola]
MTTRSVRLPLPASGLLAAGLFLGAPLTAQEAPGPWSATIYLQQSWPKQTETNRQIKDINAALGSSFKTWDDVANLNLGLQVFRDLDPHWKVGLEWDVSKGRIHGTSTTTFVTIAPQDPVTYAFEQKYTLYTDLLAVAQYRPLGTQHRWTPFLLLGLGVAYEEDHTTLTMQSNFAPLNDTLVQVDNHGWFPMLTAGVGVDVYLTERRAWYVEAGASYTWARLKHDVPAHGSLVPPTVRADTDSTGPNVWLGLGRRF